MEMEMDNQLENHQIVVDILHFYHTNIVNFAAISGLDGNLLLVVGVSNKDSELVFRPMELAGNHMELG
jgi:hypothetical protein